MERRAKIVATLGPASEAEQVLERLVLAGLDVARLNFSHGTQASHESRARAVRALASRHDRPLAILQDLQGPKIRIGELPAPIELLPGQPVRLVPEQGWRAVEGRPGMVIPIEFRPLFRSVKKGDRILLDDGRLTLRVLSTGPRAVEAETVQGGTLSSHKGINLPGVPLRLPSLTNKDAADLDFGLALGVDLVAISFVRTAQDVRRVKDRVISRKGDQAPLVIAKLERPEALENLTPILEAADGVMVARGDLGVEVAPEEVPGMQKLIIREANRRGKLVITATQMLESMVQNPLPTRAEASDVANAIYDGTDAVMLSAETAAGSFPVEAVSMMDRIVRQAEADFGRWGRSQPVQEEEHDDAFAVCLAAAELAHDRDVQAIAIFTRTGRSAVLLSKVRPCVPILAFTPLEATYQRLSLAWGVAPHRVPWADTVEDMIGHVDRALKENGAVPAGGQVVLVTGYPVREISALNMALLHTVR